MNAVRPPGLWRLLGPALVAWAASAALIHAPGAARIAAGLAGLTGALACLACFASRLPRARAAAGVALLFLAALLLVSMRIHVLEQVRGDPLLATAAAASRSVAATVRLAGYPESRAGFDGRANAWARAQFVSLDGERTAGAAPVMLWLPRPAPDHFFPGLVLDVEGTLVRGPPEGRDAYEMRVKSFEEVAETGALPSIGGLAAELRATLRKAASGRAGAELVPGLAVGDTALVDDELERLMLASSLTHLVAVSGSNCALVIAAAVWVASRLGCGRRVRNVVAAAALGGFVVLVGPDASVQRAAVMAGVLLVSGFGGKQRQALPALGLAILLLLGADPWQSIQPGFALSVAATAGILLGVPSLESWLRLRGRLPRMLALPVAVASVAQAACAPLLLLLQPGLPVGGVLANLVAAPAAPFGTGLGLLSLVLLPISSALGGAALWLAMWPARWITAAGELGLALPFGRWYWPGGWAGALLLCGAGVLLACAWLLARGARHSGPWRAAALLSARLRAAIAATVASGSAMLVAIVLVVPLAVQAGVPRDWLVVACDIGQGDAILLRDPARPQHTMLVDVGDDPAKLVACLDLFGVGRIDLLVLTHDDRDHVGALSAVADRVDSVLISPPSAEHEGERPLLRELQRAGLDYRIGTLGMRGGGAGAGDVRWELIGPRPSSRYEDPNATSLVLLVEVAGARVLLLGDTGAEEQEWIARARPDLRADIVKVAHHGSRDQAMGLYNRLGAGVALISVGENRYGHPNTDLLGRLAAAGAAPLRTDELGSIAIRLRGDRLEPWAAGRRSEVAAGMNVGASR